MDMTAMTTLVVALVVGVFSYTIARRLKIPAILFYLVAGILVGPLGLGVVDTSSLGSGLSILVELAVGIILFEGGLSLPAQGFKKAPVGIKRILLVVLPLTGIGAGLLGHFMLGLSWQTAILFGAIIVVTGPTVIGPLLKSVNLTPRLESILHWESIWGDCIGVILAAVAIEIVTVDEVTQLGHVGLVFALRIVIGVAFGIGGGLVLAKIILPWAARLGDEGLPGIIAVAAALGLFGASNALVESSGPLTAALAGFTLSFTKAEGLEEVRHFKEQIASLFISSLFVLLSAHIDPMASKEHLVTMVILAGILGFVIRPIAVYVAMARTCIPIRERVYLGLIGPRGIIAIATASYASFMLTDMGQEMMLLMTATFVIIFMSGTFTTLFGKLLGGSIGVCVPLNQTGIVIVGVNSLTLALSRLLKEVVPVRFVDMSPPRCLLADQLGYDVDCISGLNDHIYEDAADLGYSRALVATPNNAMNALVVQKASYHFGTGHAHRVLSINQPDAIEPVLLDGRDIAFSSEFFSVEADKLVETNRARVARWTMGDALDGTVYPLFTLDGDGVSLVKPGDTPTGAVIALLVPHGKLKGDALLGSGLKLDSVWPVDLGPKPKVDIPL